MFLTLTSDVEDLITEESDDAVRTIADMLSEIGVQVTFCVVGEKARLLKKRGRTDVVEALSRHDIGYHSNFHSVHPTVVEYLADKGWQDGITEAVARETSGVEDVSTIFGRLPSCWGGPGNTWGPQINPAMTSLNVPSVIYAHTGVPRGDIHRFCGAICYPLGLSLRDGEYHIEGTWQNNLAALQKKIADLRDRGVQWSEVFIGHPTRIIHEEFWDATSLSGGRNPPRHRWIAPKRKSDSDLAAALANMRKSIEALARIRGIEIRTIGEMNALCENSREEGLSEAELAEVRVQIDSRVAGMAGWVILPPSLSTGNLRRLTAERLGTLRRIRLSG